MARVGVPQGSRTDARGGVQHRTGGVHVATDRVDQCVHPLEPPFVPKSMLERDFDMAAVERVVGELGIALAALRG